MRVGPTVKSTLMEILCTNQTCSKACGESWGVPCGWEALKNLPDVCDDRETGPNNFVAQFPGASKNIEPSQVIRIQLFT